VEQQEHQEQLLQPLLEQTAQEVVLVEVEE
jgi:hypothetical protein